MSMTFLQSNPKFISIVQSELRSTWGERESPDVGSSRLLPVEKKNAQEKTGSAADTSIDEYTLTAYGDISITKADFLPGPIAASSPARRRTVRTTKQKGRPRKPRKDQEKADTPLVLHTHAGPSPPSIHKSSVNVPPNRPSQRRTPLVAPFIRRTDSAYGFMSARLPHTSLVGDGDWEIITTHSPQTPFSAVSWAFRPPQDPQHKRKAFHGSLFTITSPSRRETAPGSDHQRPTTHQTHGPTHADDSLNPDLPGVLAALEAVLIYEECVGFNFTSYPEIHPTELLLDSHPFPVVHGDEDPLRVHQDRWRETVDDLMNPDLVHTESDESLASSMIDSLSSSIDLHQSAATLSSEATSSDGSVDSFVMPETPKAKPLAASVEISGLSPSSSEVLSPGRGLNASASSFVPTFLSQLHDEPLQFPSLHDPPSPSRTRRGTKGKHKPHTSSGSSFANFTFPTLNGTPAGMNGNEDNLPAAGTADASSEEAPTKDLLPPFLQESPGRSRARKSRTREIVDRLRSRAAAAATNSTGEAKASTSLLEDPVPIRFASHSPGPVSGDDLSLSVSSIASRQTVSEDGGDRGIHSLVSFEEDESGWIDIASPPSQLVRAVTPPPVISKPNRARDLVLALARRRTNSQSSELPKEDNSSHVSTSTPTSSSSSTNSKSPSPPAPDSLSPATTSATSSESHHSPLATTTTVPASSSLKVDNTLKTAQAQQQQGQKSAKPKPPPSPTSARHNSQHNRKQSMSHLSRSSISSAASTSPTGFMFNPNQMPSFPTTVNAPLMALGGTHYYFPAGAGYPMNTGASLMSLGVPFVTTPNGPTPVAGSGYMPFSAGTGVVANGGPSSMAMKPHQGHHPHLVPNMSTYPATAANNPGAAASAGVPNMGGHHLGLGHGSGKGPHGHGPHAGLGMNVNAIQVPGTSPYGNPNGW